jgi:hypothetical protein
MCKKHTRNAESDNTCHVNVRKYPHVSGCIVGQDAQREAGQSTTLAARFWSKVDRRSDDECWPWLGSKSEGYGTMRVDGDKRQATHVAWFLTHGVWVPVDRLIMHSCDNPPCCNPGHLILGTHALNALDAQDKGRRKKRDFWADFPEVMTCRDLTRIYPRKLGGIRKGVQQRSKKLPTPCSARPYLFRREDVRRHVERMSA